MRLSLACSFAMQHKTKTMEETLAWARGERTRGLSSLKTNILGIEVDGGDIGLLGPVALAGLQLYLLFYLLQIRAGLAPTTAARGVEIGRISPWSGSSRHWLGVSLNTTSLVTLPLLAVWLALNRLLGAPFWVAIPLALISGAMGLMMFVLGRRLSLEKVPAGGGGGGDD